MNKEQNIDDILKLLKSSYSEAEGDGNSIDDSQKNDDALTHDELQRRLKAQFMSGDSKSGVSDEESDSYSYTLDDDFLAESVSAQTEVADDEDAREEDKDVATQNTEDEEDDGLPPFDLEDEAAETEEIEEFEEVEESEEIQEIEEVEEVEEVEEIEEIEEIEEAEDLEEDQDEDDIFLDDMDEEDEDAEDGVFIENGDGDIILLRAQSDSAPYTEDSSDDVLSMLEDFDEPIFEDDAEEPSEPEIAESEPEAAEAVAEPELFSDGSGQLALFEKEENGEENESVPIVEDELPADEENQLSVDFGDEADTESLQKEPSEDTAQISDSVLSLMFEFGDVSAAGGSFDRERIDNYVSRKRRKSAENIDPASAFAFDGEEFESAEQTEKLYGQYIREKYFTLLRVLGCGFFALLMLGYELAGGLGLVFENMKYFPVYMLIDMQLIVLCAIFAWRELFAGIKRAFTFRAGRWSVLALVVAFTLVYDIALIVIGVDDMPLTFGTLACVYLLFGMITEYLSVCREIKCFEVYASDKKKFTFDTSPKAGSSADKMYRGGLPYEKKVFEMRDIQFPKGYFAAVNRLESTDTIVNYSITPVVVLSTLALLACVMLGDSVDLSLGVFMVTLTLLAPISSFATHIFPMCYTTSKLYERECAIAGEVMANKYGGCDYIIFSDMHLFKKADIHNNGIVIYDEKNSRAVVEYLDALYGAIGGPMRGVFGGVSKAEHQVRLRRIARNGVEAAIDGKHSLILGEADFLKRYGIGFEGASKVKDRDGILGFAIDGKLCAKLCLRYETEPLFEIIATRMEQNGMKCAIETYDPIINGAFVAACRKDKCVPINVIHKNVADYYARSNSEIGEDTGLVVSSSRFKLVESVIWCKRLRSVLKICGASQIVLSAVFCGALVAALCLGFMPYIDQYAVLLCQVLSVAPVLAAMALRFPHRDYFSLDNNKNKKKKQRTDK